MLKHLDENPLRPFVIRRIGGGDFLVPIIREAKGIDLTFEVRDVLFGEHIRMLVVLDGKLLCRQAESIPTHRVKNIKALHSLHTGNDIGCSITFWMAHMKSLSRRIREHVENVIFWFGKIVCVAVERIFSVPNLTPFFFDCFVVVTHTRQL